MVSCLILAWKFIYNCVMFEYYALALPTQIYACVWMPQILCSYYVRDTTLFNAPFSAPLHVCSRIQAIASYVGTYENTLALVYIILVCPSTFIYIPNALFRYRCRHILVHCLPAFIPGESNHVFSGHAIQTHTPNCVYGFFIVCPACCCWCHWLNEKSFSRSSFSSSSCSAR